MALLDNSARPSGALVYTARDGNLTPDQVARLKAERLCHPGGRAAAIRDPGAAAFSG